MSNCHQLTPQPPVLKAGWRLVWVIRASLLVVLLLAGCDSPATGLTDTFAPPETTVVETTSPTTFTSIATRTAESTAAPTTPSPVITELDPTPTPDSGQVTARRTPTNTRPVPTVTPCQVGQCSFPGDLLLARPISSPANDQVDTSYRFGSTQEGRRDPHHGVEFLNRRGTPVYAAGAGVVVVAGNDQDTRYSPFLNFYGNLVVIKHELSRQETSAWPAFPTPVFTLYAHLSQISVEPGEDVSRGQQIGLVGMTGSALGNHLHFEVRLGENTYQAVSNPELWLAPGLAENGQQKGIIAGRVISPRGRQIGVNEVIIQHLPEGPDGVSGRSISLNSYEESALIGQSPWQESFAAGNLDPGWYRVSFPYFGIQSQLVHLPPGQIIIVVFHLN